VTGNRADHAGSSQGEGSGGPHVGWFKWYKENVSFENAAVES
jgi:hypothetical protein